MIAHVALPLPIHRTFSYVVPDTFQPFVAPGLRVGVPFGSRSLVGFVVEVEDGEGEGLKPVSDLIDCFPLIDEACLALCRWSARYYLAPLGLALKYAPSSAIKIDRYCRIEALDPSVAALDGLTLKKACATSDKPRIFDYVRRSMVRLHDVFTDRPIEAYQPEGSAACAPPILYRAGVGERKEHYLSLIAGQLAEGRNVLMLLPDRHIVGDFFSRPLLERFPDAVLWYHSGMTEKKRAEVYFRARTETGRVLLGSKSAVFLALARTGLIIVERPEEDEFRNEEAFKFNAVQVAMKRAALEGAGLVLGSVAPPVDVMRKAADGAVVITEGRAAPMPPVSHEQNRTGRPVQDELPETLIRTIEEAIAQGGNAVVHTPRKAYAGHLYCVACGRPLECPHCTSAGLGYSRSKEMLTCNTCRHTFPYIEKCPSCGSDLIRFFDVGAEYFVERLSAVFPDAPVIKMTGDEGRAGSYRAVMKAAAKGGCIIVGTHILSKCVGLATETLILLGWEDFLKTGGYRVREKAFQLFANLVDALAPGRVVVQDYGRGSFDASLFLDAAGFYKDELQRRRMAEFPPYTRFFLLQITKRSREAGQKVIAAIEKLAQHGAVEQQMLGPIEVKGRYGWRIILKGSEEELEALLQSVSRMSGVHVEPDPLYF
jgi:primosomal protein N' (replication factor Y)